MNSKGMQVLTGVVWPITLLQFEMLLFPVAGSSLLAVVGATTAKSAEGNICLHLSCFHTTSSMNPSSVTAQDETLTFPQSSWRSSSSTASVLGMVIQSTHQWIRDFHLSYWPCSSDAQHPGMKKIRENFAQLTVWREPEINLEAAKPAETTFLTRSTAESWPDTEPAEVSEKLQSKSNGSRAGVAVTKSRSERWRADLLKHRCRSTSYLCMHSYTAHMGSPPKCRLWIAIG